MENNLNPALVCLKGKILDVRSAEEFCRGHLLGAASHPLTAFDSSVTAVQDLDQALPSIFLPPRHEPLLVVARDHGVANQVARLLEARGRVSVQSLGWQDFQVPNELLETGPTRNHLWEPPPWLEKHLSLLPPPAAGPVLDLACGSGRALVWLAQLGYRTVGLDWQPEALEMGRVLAASRNVRCEFRAADLRDPQQVPRGLWSVILNFRFLQRELLAEMPKMLQPGGVVLVRTFRQVPGYEGHPHRRHRLQTGELLRAFPAAGHEVLAHEEGFDPDGRPAAGILARRLL